MRGFRQTMVGWKPWATFGLALVVLAGRFSDKLIADDASTSARAKLQELRKAREKQEKVEKRGKPAKDGAQSKYPWSSPDDVTYIDAMLQEEWKALGFPVSDAAQEGEFLRRVTLDTIGRIPTLEETKEYLHNKQPDKKEKLIDRLLSSDEYGKHWATVWLRMLITEGQEGRDVSRQNLRAWLEKEFNRNTPWNAMVTELVAGTGHWEENGAVNFMIANMQNNNNSRAISYMTKLFLGVQSQCTECHNHPWNEWKQEQFHGLRAFMNGTRERRVTATSPNGQQITDYIALEETPYSELGESMKTATYEPRNALTLSVLPTFIDGRDFNALTKGEKFRVPSESLVAIDKVAESVANFKLGDEREEPTSNEPVYLRKVLAKAMVAEDNPYFARSIVNRMWYYYFGHSFVRNVDDFDNGQDEPSMPDLLDRLASDFRANGHDIKRLIRWITLSKAYALSSKQKPRKAGSDDPSSFFVSMLVKPMSAEQLYDSVLTFTQVHKTSKTENTGAQRAQFLREFERTFGTDEIPTAAPRYEGTITSSLMMMNSPLIMQACGCTPGSFLHGLVTDKSLKDQEVVNELYLAGLCRQPNSAERTQIGKMLQYRNASERAEVFQDIVWSILNTAEFSLNH